MEQDFHGMRITYLNPIGGLGGAERVLLDFLAGVRRAQPGWQLSLIAGGDGPLIAEAAALGVATEVLSMPERVARLGDSRPDQGTGSKAGLRGYAKFAASAGELPFYLLRLRRRLAAARPDVVHTNGQKMHVLGTLAAPRKVPVIWHLHEFLKTRPLMSTLLPRLSGRCSAAIAISECVAAEARALWGSAPQVVTVHNAIDLERFSPQGPVTDLDALAGLGPCAEGTLRIGFVSTMAWWKGHAVFLRALSRLSDVPLRAYVIGGAVYKTEHSQAGGGDLARMVTELGLRGRVGFTGHLADVAPALRGVDVVVHASTRPEPFGLVIAEAMACGRMVVAANGGATREFIESGHNALLHEPGDDAGLAMTIRHLSEHRELWKEMQEAAVQTARARFNRERLAAELLPVYRSVTQSSRDRGGPVLEAPCRFNSN